jgi:hypothetical protein
MCVGDVRDQLDAQKRFNLEYAFVGIFLSAGEREAESKRAASY